MRRFDDSYAEAKKRIENGARGFMSTNIRSRISPTSIKNLLQIVDDCGNGAKISQATYRCMKSFETGELLTVSK